MDIKLLLAGVSVLAGLFLLFKPMIQGWVENVQKSVPKELFSPEVVQTLNVKRGSSLNKELDSLQVLVDGVENEEERAILVDKIGVSLLKKHFYKKG